MQLNFKQFGESGKPLIILHGLFGLLDNWLTIGKTISEHGYKVFLVDQRNHGRSPHEAPLSFPAFAADLKEFISQQHIQDPVLIGHSMGGKTVMEYALTNPGTYGGLVVVDIGPKPYPVHHQKILEGLNAMNLKEVENRNQADEMLSRYEPALGVRQFLLKNLYRKEEGGFAWRFNLPLLTSDIENIGAEVRSDLKVEVPALFMRGEKSDYILDEDWAGILKMFPNARLETIANAGHWIQADQPKSFVAALLEFMDKAVI
ncbi:alpha/beta fold hydrolase [Dyadobacter flavalbus]|uniref:Alpha/beta fold hydrolase n=1 Tax=Dyadobacter flavalbus TaxID=2579942 RepID=A0A5M8QVL4_9BACT|nr:alpha/beta fold hydrolase [Dyadobacter flavalbus]KAA6438676.1 alpha/beta fold hydrolase [Dyadobacter flavalbus]